jgi:prepilin-type N-terminal cleavage/methylation domain-containing protein
MYKQIHIPFFRSRGFTLIELLVVIAIIGILSSIVIASLDSSRKKGRDAKRLSDIKQIQLALALYYDQNTSYPGSISSLADSCGLGVTCSSLYLTGPGYIAAMPKDPNSTASNIIDYVYYPYSASGAGSGDPCIGYHLGTDLELYNASIFQNDSDQIDPSTGSYPTGMGAGKCANAPSSSTGFNGSDGSSPPSSGNKCNALDPGSYCYDVLP